MTSHIAAASGAAVLSVEYRLAPEHKAPAAAEDALAALRFVCSGVGAGNSSPAAAALGLDEITAVGVAGDSVGGNLAAVAALAAAQEGLPLDFQLLLFPWVDTLRTPEAHRPSRLLFAESHFLTKADMDFFNESSFGTGLDVAADWIVSPIAAPAHLLRRTAPALVVTADHDVLLDEGRAYASKLASSGCHTGAYPRALLCNNAVCTTAQAPSDSFVIWPFLTCSFRFVSFRSFPPTPHAPPPPTKQQKSIESTQGSFTLL